MPDDRVEGRAQGIRDVRELKREGAKAIAAASSISSIPIIMMDRPL